MERGLARHQMLVLGMNVNVMLGGGKLVLRMILCSSFCLVLSPTVLSTSNVEKKLLPLHQIGESIHQSLNPAIMRIAEGAHATRLLHSPLLVNATRVTTICSTPPLPLASKNAHLEWTVRISGLASLTDQIVLQPQAYLIIVKQAQSSEVALSGRLLQQHH